MNSMMRRFTRATMGVLVGASLLHCGAPPSDADFDVAAESEGALERFEADVVVEPETNLKETEVREKDESDEPTLKANWDMDGQADSNGTSITVWWGAQPGLTYKLCWKKVGQFGSACWYNSLDITAGNGSYYSGFQYAGIHGLECGGTEYKITVKKGLSKDSTTVATGACGCSNPCPQGGWYDGANCQIGQAPAGTTAFIWDGNYYYSALPGNHCPYPGSWYDGANCFVQSVPSGVSPFIWANHWYYAACP